MSQDAFLTTFLAGLYGLHPVAFSPLGLNRTDRRMLYRVDHASGQSWVLRAYPQDDTLPWWFGGGQACEWLRAQAATLVYLAQHHYPAPRLLPTLTGEFLGLHEGWCGLISSFIPGNRLENSPHNMRLLASALARLHTVHAGIALPGAHSWWYPPQVLAGARERLRSVAPAVPPRWQGLAATCEHTLRAIQHCPTLPLSIIHGDCWPENALHLSEGRVMLLDWECAGVGMPVLDLGTLLVDCHPDPVASQPIQPDPQRIAAVVDGYAQERTLTRPEIAVLPEAIRFTVAFQATIRFSWTDQEGWSERVERSLTRLHARLRVCEQIAPIVEDRLEQLAGQFPHPGGAGCEGTKHT